MFKIEDQVVKKQMEFTGERFLPSLDIPEISYEHWHRYLFASQLVADKVVLDIACGEGYGSGLLAQTAQKVVGVDISEAVIEAARVNYQKSNLDFLVGSMSSIPVEGQGIFDGVISFESIEHIRQEEQDLFLQEVRRVLKPGGFLCISTPNKKVYSDAPNYHNEFHLKEFYIPEFEAFLARSFKNQKLFGHKTYPASYIWDLIEEGSIFPQKFKEFRITDTGHGFSPTREAKETLYCIAVCSDGELEQIPGSVMLDLSNKYIRLISQIYGQLMERVQTTNAISARLEQIDAEYDQTRQELEQARKGLQQARNELAQTNKEVEETKAQLSLSPQTIHSISAERDRVSVESENLKAELGQSRAQVSEYFSTLRAIFAERDRLSVESGNLKAELGQSRIQVSEYISTLQAISAERDRLSGESENLKTELGQSRVQVSEYIKTLQTVSNAKEQLSLDYERTRTELDQAKAELVAFALSTSWKITRPLRRLVDFMRGRRRWI